MSGSSSSDLPGARHAGGNPYVGPRPFEAGEKLYGRDREIAELIDRLNSERIVLLHSPSGAGKSSLIQAGLLPQLQDSFDVWGPTRVNLDPPVEGVNRYVASANQGFEEGVPERIRRSAETLARQTLSEYFGGRPRRRRAPPNALLVFDQFEEVLSVDPLAVTAKREFFDQLGDLLRNPRIWALFALREDFLAPLEGGGEQGLEDEREKVAIPYARRVPTHFKNRFRIDLLSLGAAREAIVEPARVGGREFPAVDQLLNDLAAMKVQLPDGSFRRQTGHSVEPVQLQVVCRRLWDAMPADDLSIDPEDLAEFGDVDQALGAYYDDSVARIADGDLGVERGVREWFDDRLITPGGVRGQVLMESDASGGLDNSLIERLRDTHLVRAEKRAGATWFELAHDRLLEPVRQSNAAWREKRLTEWQQRASLWEKQGRPDGLLLLGPELIEARESAELAVQPTEVESLFLERSREQQALLEKDLRQRRRARLGIVSAIIALLAIVAGTIVGIKWKEARDNLELLRIQEILIKASAKEAREKADEARMNARRANWQSWLADGQRFLADKNAKRATQALFRANEEKERAERQAALADARRLASLAESLSADQTDLAVLLALQSTRRSSTIEAQRSLIKVLQSPIEMYLRASSAMLQAAFSPDGRLLASADRDGRIILWDMESGRPLKTLEGHSDAAFSVAFSPNRPLLASAGEYGEIILWNLESSRPLTKLEGPGAVFRVTFSPDGRLLASAHEYGEIILWELESGRRLKTLNGHSTAGAVSVAFSPDGQLLASAGEDPKIILWDLESGRRLKTLEGHSDEVYSVAFKPNGRLLASAGEDAKIILWELESGQPLKTLEGHSGAASSVAFSPDGRLLASAGEDAKIILWDLQSGRRLKTLEGHSETAYSVAFSPDGRLLASAGEDAKIILWELQRGRILKTLEGHSGWATGVAFGPDGRLASAGGDGTVILWDLQSGRLQMTLQGHSGTVSGVAFGPDGRLASAGWDGKVILWDLQSGRPQTALQGHSGTVTGVAFGPDGRLASAGKDGKVILWDLQSGRPQTALQGHSGPAFTRSGSSRAVSGVAFGPDGRLASAGWDGKVILWDLQSGRPQMTLQGHSGTVTGVAFGPDGRLLASAGQDAKIILWELQSARPLMTLAGHSRAAAFSPDGRLLASAGADARIILWDLKSGSPQATLEGQSRLQHVAFSPDGRLLASAGADPNIILWQNVDLAFFQARACRTANRNLTCEEWSQYIGSAADYKPTCRNLPAPDKCP